MSVIRCGSSHLMTGLLVWRNPHGRDEDWPELQRVENQWKLVGRVLVAELGLALLAVTAAVETVAYAILAGASLALYPITRKPCTLCVKLLQR